MQDTLNKRINLHQELDHGGFVVGQQGHHKGTRSEKKNIVSVFFCVNKGNFCR